jgi:hypothetical protein
MIAIEGIEVKARMIPKKQLVSTWKTLTVKPFPKVKAFRLDDNDFDRFIQLRKCRDDERREKEEWGTVLSARGTDACVFNADKSSAAHYVILIRETPYHHFGEVLKHELSHIVRGDLSNSKG